MRRLSPEIDLSSPNRARSPSHSTHTGSSLLQKMQKMDLDVREEEVCRSASLCQAAPRQRR